MSHLPTEPSAMSPVDVTLIVAATSKMGIGFAGGLPWKGLKKEMAYFARVTKRAPRNAQNTVVMGRKTWDSIPQRFQPLKDRANVVISRTAAPESINGALLAKSLRQSLLLPRASDTAKVFVIGGAQIYAEALKHDAARRILLTRVMTDFDCDAFFPLHLNEDGTAEGWVRKSKGELDSWVGETVPDGVQQEGGTSYVFEMWERTE